MAIGPVWVDAHLSPSMAAWLETAFGVQAAALRDVGMRDAEDRDIFLAARAAGAVVLTKDADFVRLQDELGPPPRIVWLTLGNCSNQRLREVLAAQWTTIEAQFANGEPLVEITHAI